MDDKAIIRYISKLQEKRLGSRLFSRINSVESVQATRELADMVKRAEVLMQHGTRGGKH